MTKREAIDHIRTEADRLWGESRMGGKHRLEIEVYTSIAQKLQWAISVFEQVPEANEPSRCSGCGNLEQCSIVTAPNPRRKIVPKTTPSPAIGDLRWWHMFAPTDQQRYMHTHRVNSVDEAKQLIRDQTEYDLQANDDRGRELVYMNAFGLEVYEEDGAEEGDGPGWCEWYDDEGRDIMRIMDEEDE